MRNKEDILNDWPEIVANAKRTPIGYIRDVRDDNVYWIPDLEKIFHIDEALDQLDAGISLREVADWLSQKIEDAPSHAGLNIIRKRLRPNFIRKRQPPKVVKKTMAQRAEELRRKKNRLEKLKIKNAEKRIAKREQEIDDIRGTAKADKVPLLVSEPGDGYDWDAIEVGEDEQVIFRPNPGPQTEFLAATELEVLYGGAAGGGKSFALVVDPMRYFGMRGFNGIVVRRTNDELRELVRISKDLYPKAYPGCKFSEKSSTWSFPSGAQFWMTYLERDDDVMRYHGQAFTWVGFDELTQYPTPYAWNFMRSRVRTADPEMKPYLCMRATTNPGGPGHGWVKEMFIDPAPPGKPFVPFDFDTGQEYRFPKGHAKEGQPLFYRRFIPAKVSDNPYLYEDGVYEANLLSLPEHQRRQLLEGDWSIVAGAAFPEFREHIHVVEPFEIPSEWKRFRSCDFGYSARSASAVHWYAVDPNNTVYVYRELYVNQKTGDDLGRLILDLEKDEKIAYGVLDSAVWEVKGSSGPSIAEEILRTGCRFRPADKGPGSRTNGKNQIHKLLKIDEFTEKPGLLFFNKCRKIIANLQVMPVDPDGKDDIDSRFADDHAYDSLRYGVMTRPIANSPWNQGKTGRTYSHYRPADTKFGY